ncbi:Hypothetical protein POVN_LOCUS124 [uncultured virus]|nr:Hypothetical protein POVN_LOCUS124 [uncultured virus]
MTESKKQTVDVNSFTQAVIVSDFPTFLALRRKFTVEYETPLVVQARAESTCLVFGAASGHNIVVCYIGMDDKGAISVAIAEKALTALFGCKVVAIIGTCGSLNKAVVLGDTIATTAGGVFQGDFHDGKFIKSGHLNPPDDRYLSLVSMYLSERMMTSGGSWLSVQSKAPERMERESKFHAGAMFSTSVRLEDSKTRDSYTAPGVRARNVLGVDTVSAGLATGDETGYIGLFGVSHLSDEKAHETHELWKDYAADAVTTLYVNMLRTLGRSTPFPYVQPRTIQSVSVKDNGKQIDIALFDMCFIVTDHIMLACMLKLVTEEYRCVLSGSAIYTFARMGERNVIITALPSGAGGMVNTAILVRTFRNTFPTVRQILFLGFGTSLIAPPGDVCTSSREGVLQGTFADNGTFMELGNLQRPRKALLAMITQTNALLLTEGMDQFKLIGERIAMSMGEDGRKLFATTSEVKVHEGAIISSFSSFEKLSAQKRAKAQVPEEVVCFETEAAGVASNGDVDHLIIDGIIAKKEDKFLAAKNLASYVGLMMDVKMDKKRAEVLARCDIAIPADTKDAELQQVRQQIVQLRLDMTSKEDERLDSLFSKLSLSQDSKMQELKGMLSGIAHQTTTAVQESKSVMLKAISDSTLHGFPFGVIVLPREFASLSPPEKMSRLGEFLNEVMSINLENLVSTQYDLYILCEAECYGAQNAIEGGVQRCWHRFGEPYPIKKMNASFKKLIPYIKMSLAVLSLSVGVVKMASGLDFSDGEKKIKAGVASMTTENKLASIVTAETQQRLSGEQLKLLRELVCEDDTRDWQDEIAGLLPISCTRKGVLGKEGSFYWLCPSHHRLMTKYNEGSVSDDEARAACCAISDTQRPGRELPFDSKEFKVKQMVAGPDALFLSMKDKSDKPLVYRVDAKSKAPMAMPLPSGIKKVVSCSVDAASRLWVHADMGALKSNIITHQTAAEWDQYTEVGKSENSAVICAKNDAELLVNDGSGALKTISSKDNTQSIIALGNNQLTHSASMNAKGDLWLITKDKAALYSRIEGKWQSHAVPFVPLSVHVGGETVACVSKEGVLYQLLNEKTLLGKWSVQKWLPLAEGVTIRDKPRTLGVCDVNEQGMIYALCGGVIKMW